MLTYEDTNFFALDLLETKQQDEAFKFQRTVSLGAVLYKTETLLDMFLFFQTLMDQGGNAIIEYHDPEWFLRETVRESAIPVGQEGLVAICKKINPKTLEQEYNVVVNGRQANKVAILSRLNALGVL